MKWTKLISWYFFLQILDTFKFSALYYTGFFLQIFGILLHSDILSSYGTKQTRMNEALFSSLRRAAKHKAKARAIGAAVKGAFRAFDAYKPKEVKRFRKSARI